MRCEEIQEILLTDYQDGELSQERKKMVEHHLISCAPCRTLAEAVRKISIEPFSKAQTSNFSQEDIWEKLKERIEGEQTPVLEKHFFNPRPVFGLVSFVILIMIIARLDVFPSKTQMVEGVSHEEKIESLGYLMEEVTVESDETDSGYGTAIEEFLL